jgi:AcrR family transcriptional regulator
MPPRNLPVAESQEPDPGRTVRSDTYERLLSEAAALFRKRGYDATSTRALADSLGIQKASLYHHISNKEQLLYEMAVRSMDRMDARIRAAVDEQTDPVERLGALIESHVTAMLEQPDPYAASLLELKSLTGEHGQRLIKRRRDYEETLDRMVHDAQEAGAVRTDIPSKLLALLMLGTMNWTLFWYRPEGSVPPRELAAMVRAVTLSGLVLPVPER